MTQNVAAIKREIPGPIPSLVIQGYPWLSHTQYTDANNHSQRTSMLTRHCISKTYISPSHALLTAVLRSRYILMTSRWYSLSVPIKIVAQPLSTMGQYTFTLESMVIPLPSPHPRQDNTYLSLDGHISNL